MVQTPRGTEGRKRQLSSTQQGGFLVSLEKPAVLQELPLGYDAKLGLKLKAKTYIIMVDIVDKILKIFLKNHKKTAAKRKAKRGSLSTLSCQNEYKATKCSI